MSDNVKSNSLNLRDDPKLLKIVKENLSLHDLKNYVISNRIFNSGEISWVHFFWKTEVENIMILLVQEFLEFHFGYRGIRAFHNFDQNVLKNEELNLKEGTSYIKVGRDNVLVQEYLRTHPDVTSTVFYLLSPFCYSQCLMHAKTEQARAAHSYLAKMNLIAIKMASVILATKIKNLQVLNANSNEELEVINNKIERSKNIVQKMNVQYQEDMSALQNKCNQLVNKSVTRGENQLMLSRGGLPQKVTNRRNGSTTKLENLLKVTASTCRLCDVIISQIKKGNLQLDADIPDKEARFVCHTYARNALSTMQPHIVFKTEVPKELFLIVEQSCILADIFLTQLNSYELNIDLKIHISADRSTNRNYGEDMFMRLVSAADSMKDGDDSYHDIEDEIDLDDFLRNDL